MAIGHWTSAAYARFDVCALFLTSFWLSFRSQKHQSDLQLFPSPFRIYFTSISFSVSFRFYSNYNPVQVLPFIRLVQVDERHNGAGSAYSGQ